MSAVTKLLQTFRTGTAIFEMNGETSADLPECPHAGGGRSSLAFLRAEMLQSGYNRVTAR